LESAKTVVELNRCLTRDCGLSAPAALVFEFSMLIIWNSLCWPRLYFISTSLLHDNIMTYTRSCIHAEKHINVCRKMNSEQRILHAWVREDFDSLAKKPNTQHIHQLTLGSEKIWELKIHVDNLGNRFESPGPH